MCLYRTDIGEYVAQGILDRHGDAAFREDALERLDTLVEHLEIRGIASIPDEDEVARHDKVRGEIAEIVARLYIDDMDGLEPIKGPPGGTVMVGDHPMSFSSSGRRLVVPKDMDKKYRMTGDVDLVYEIMFPVQGASEYRVLQPIEVKAGNSRMRARQHRNIMRILSRYFERQEFDRPYTILPPVQVLLNREAYKFLSRKSVSWAVYLPYDEVVRDLATNKLEDLQLAA